MGYSTETDIQNVISQSLTSATSQTTDGLGTLSSLVNIGNVWDKNLVTTSVIDYYIQLADSEIDGMLSELYKTPLCEMVDFESTLYSDIEEYNPYIVLEYVCPLSAGDIVILTSNGMQERHIIQEAISGTVFSTESEIQYLFPEGTRIIRVSYSPPVRFISARLAAANIYDKYFSAEVSPATSEVGEKLRELAYSRVEDILNGTIILHGQHRIGRRFFNPNLIDQYSLPSGGNNSKNYGKGK